MTCRSVLLLTGSLLLFVNLYANLGPQQSNVELFVKVSDETGQPIVYPVQVFLLNPSGIPLTDAMSNDKGEARFPSVEPGSYRLRVSSPDVEETTTAIAFVLHPRESFHNEHVQVRLKRSAQNPGTGPVSAAVLNIPKKAAKEFEQGLNAMIKKDWPAAISRFEKATQLYPRYASAFNNLGVIAMQSGDRSGGEGYFRKAIAVDEKFAASYVNLAKALIPQNKIGEAKEMLKQATALDAGDPECLYLLAVMEVNTGGYPSALAAARKVHALEHARFAAAHFVAGKVLQAQNKPEEAAAEYRIFLKEAPNSPTAAQALTALATIENKSP